MAVAGLVLRAADAVDAEARVWSAAHVLLEQAARLCAQALAAEWSSRAGEAFRDACERRIGELVGLIALAQEAEGALRAHADALRDLASAVPELPDLPELPDSSGWGTGLPDALTELPGGLLEDAEGFARRAVG